MTSVTHRRAALVLFVIVSLAAIAHVRTTGANSGTTIHLPLIFDSAVCQVASMTPATTLPATSSTVAPTGSYAGTAVGFGQSPNLPGYDQISTTSPTGTVSCISCNAPAPGPIPNSNKLYPVWHPSGNWIVLVGEINGHPPYTSGTSGTTEMLNGWWMTVYLTTPDGSQWWNLTNYVPPKSGQVIGALDPHFTPDGTKLVWTELVEAPDATHQFGFWRLHEADFISTGVGSPSIQHDSDISPTGGNWFEPEDFTPDGGTILMTSDLGSQAPSYQYGQDIFTLTVQTRLTVNLTNSPYAWDEHGHYSPHQTKISWMSSSPYNNSSNPANGSNLKTEIFLMNLDGTAAQQLTHFNTPGYPEYSPENSIASESVWAANGTQVWVGQLLTGRSYPNSNKWTITFTGSCG